MGLLNYLGLGKELAQPIEAVSKLYTTDKERLAAEANLESIVQKPQLAQLENVRTMISSANFFESAWPSLMGWTSGFCVALYYIPQLLVTIWIWSLNCLAMEEVMPFPMKPDDILNLVWLLFGFGGYHLIKGKIGK